MYPQSITEIRQANPPGFAHLWGICLSILLRFLAVFIQDPGGAQVFEFRKVRAFDLHLDDAVHVYLGEYGSHLMHEFWLGRRNM